MPWIGALISVGGSLLAGSMSSDAASEASGVQQQSSAEAIAEARRQYDQTRTDLAPYRDAGSGAIRRLDVLMGASAPQDQVASAQRAKDWFASATPDEIAQWKARSYPGLPADQVEARAAGDLASLDRILGAGSLNRKFTSADFASDPVAQSGLKFGMEQGRDAINARAIAGGGYDSGATLKALTRFASDYGSTKANESYNRFTNDQNSVYNKLAGVSGLGQVANNQIVSAGQNMSNQGVDLITGAGNARAAGIVGGANAWGGALGGVTKAAGNYQTQQGLVGGGTYNPGGSGWMTGTDYYNFADGGLIRGPSHDEGGVDVEAEGGEFVIPADVVRKIGSKVFRRLIAQHHARE